MDIQAIRERMITGFKPATKNIDTPYLGDLDGQLMLQGLTGKQRIDLEEQASEDVIGKDGNVTSKTNTQKFAALAIAACLRERSTGKAIFSTIDTLGPSGNGDGLSNEMDSDVYIRLVKQVGDFIGKRSSDETKNGSEPTGDGSPASSSPQDLAEPLANSSTESTPQS